MNKGMAARLARLEQVGGEDRNTPEWLAAPERGNGRVQGIGA